MWDLMSLYICNLFICIKTHIYNLLITFAFSKLFCFESQRMILEGFICRQPQSCVGRWSALQVPGQVNENNPCWMPGGRGAVGLALRELSALEAQGPSAGWQHTHLPAARFQEEIWAQNVQPSLSVHPGLGGGVLNVKRGRHLPLLAEEDLFPGLGGEANLLGVMRHLRRRQRQKRRTA